MTRVLLTMRVTQAEGYDEPRDAVSHDWIRLLCGWGMTPLLLPNGLDDPGSYLRATAPDLIVLTGGDRPGEPEARARTEDAALAFAEESGVALIGVCRGMQVLNLAMGGRIVDVGDHAGNPHPLAAEGAWAELYGNKIEVNSYHEQGIDPDGMGTGLEVTARDRDGRIEGFVHESRPIAGMMWHPERTGAPAADRRLFERLVREGAFWR